MYLPLAADSLSITYRQFSIDDVLSPYMYVFFAAYIVAFAFTPIMRVVASYYGIIDQPDGARKMHTVPVAYLGGVAVFLGWLAGLAISQYLFTHRVEEDLPQHVVIKFSIIVGACAIVILGLWDDILHITPKAKIAGQVMAAVALLASGVGNRSTWIFIQPLATRLTAYLHTPMIDQTHWIVTATSIIFVICVVLGCCNATNLLDGLDGLCGGVTAIISAGFLFLAVNLATHSGALNVNEDGLRIVIALALLGAVLGFVPYNFNPASIFMGDTGSMFLGFASAVMIILFAAHGHFKWFLASMVMFALPVLDTTLAFVRRWVNHRPFFSADRHHIHHQLVARGFTIKQTVVINYALAIIFALLGAAIVYVRTRYAVAIYLVVFGSIIVAAYKMGMVHERPRIATRQPLTSNAASPSAPPEPSTVLELKE